MSIIESPAVRRHGVTPLAARWSAVCRLDQLEPLWGEAVLLPDGRQAALFLLPGGRLFACDNLDPEAGAMVMSRGLVGTRTVAGESRPTIASPLHKDVYDLETGRCYTDPEFALPLWRVRVRDGVVELAPMPVLVAASHGTDSMPGRAAVAALVAEVRQAAPGIRIEDAFVDVQQPDVPSVAAGIEGDAVLVPLLLSAGYHVRVDLAEAADGHRDDTRDAAVAAALGPDARLTAVLLRRLREAGWEPGDPVVLAAAGSTDPAAVADCRIAAELLAHEIGAPVPVGFVSAAQPPLRDAVEAARADAGAHGRIAVASYLLAPGYFHGLAAKLAREGGAELVSEPLLEASAPPPIELVEIVLARFTAALG
ncbi:nitrite reductase small subunit NirD [Gryllotalpicola reticulitermitis]|uniref:Nitrite reductase small subunit NirD n=1 Tax=Gryllotalpicola reticulitermitis TaxID=1184153 RepID=A0ABV8Q9A6_9MICO